MLYARYLGGKSIILENNTIYVNTYSYDLVGNNDEKQNDNKNSTRILELTVTIPVLIVYSRMPDRNKMKRLIFKDDDYLK